MGEDLYLIPFKTLANIETVRIIEYLNSSIFFKQIL